MNKAEKTQVERALAVEATHAGWAANTLATLHRAANSKTQREITALIEGRPQLRKHLRVVNGCWVAVQ